jgi:putative transposase
VVQEAYVHGVSTRNVGALAEALGLKGISKDPVSRICKAPDGQVHAFRTRPLSGQYPYLTLDATFQKVRENGRVLTMAVVIGVGVLHSQRKRKSATLLGVAEDAIVLAESIQRARASAWADGAYFSNKRATDLPFSLLLLKLS